MLWAYTVVLSAYSRVRVQQFNFTQLNTNTVWLKHLYFIM